MDKIIFRDKTLDWFERIFFGERMKAICWFIMGVASGYLGWSLLVAFMAER